jgi:hypothetical protein
MQCVFNANATQKLTTQKVITSRFLCDSTQNGANKKYSPSYVVNTFKTSIPAQRPPQNSADGVAPDSRSGDRLLRHMRPSSAMAMATLAPANLWVTRQVALWLISDMERIQLARIAVQVTPSANFCAATAPASCRPLSAGYSTASRAIPASSRARFDTWRSP